MDKSNPLYQPDYAAWKKNLWGAARAFVAAFIPVFGFMLTQIDVDILSDKDTLVKFLISLGLSSAAAGIVGLGKFLRDVFPENAIVQRIPF
jgi:hypothetical protein